MQDQSGPKNWAVIVTGIVMTAMFGSLAVLVFLPLDQFVWRPSTVVVLATIVVGVVWVWWYMIAKLLRHT